MSDSLLLFPLIVSHGNPLEPEKWSKGSDRMDSLTIGVLQYERLSMNFPPYRVSWQPTGVFRVWQSSTWRVESSIFVHILLQHQPMLRICISPAQTVTGWRRRIGCLKLRVIFRKRATNYRALWLKMTYEDKAPYDSTAPCICHLRQCYGLTGTIL